MPITEPQDLAARIASCLQRHRGEEYVVSDLEKPDGGHSANLLAFTAVRTGSDGCAHREGMIARIQPTDAVYFDQDVLREFSVMSELSRVDGFPVPPMVLAEPDPTVLGGPFFVMRRVEGRVPKGTPPFHVTGFMAEELTPDQRAEVWTNGLDVLARLHRVAVDDRFACLHRPERGASGLEQIVETVRRWHAQALGGHPNLVLDAALAHLTSNQPAPSPECVLWGDARIGNMIYGLDNRVQAVIDWEDAAIGPGEVDLAWWLVMDDMLSRTIGVPRLDGLPSREETIAHYERSRDHAVTDLRYFEILAGLRFALVMARLAAIYSGTVLGRDTTLATNNQAVRLLAELLDLPLPDLSPDVFLVMQIAPTVAPTAGVAAPA